MGTPTGFKGFLGGQFEGRCIYFFKDVTETKWDFAAVGCTRSGTLRRWPLCDFAPPPKRHCWTPTQLPPSASPRPKGTHHLTQPIPRHFRLRHRPQHRPGHGRLGQLNRRSSAAATAGTHFAASVAADILAVLDFASRLLIFFSALTSLRYGRLTWTIEATHMALVIKSAIHGCGSGSGPGRAVPLRGLLLHLDHCRHHAGASHLLRHCRSLHLAPPWLIGPAGSSAQWRLAALSVVCVCILLHSSGAAGALDKVDS